MLLYLYYKKNAFSPPKYNSLQQKFSQCVRIKNGVQRRILTHSPICSDSYLYRIPFQTGQADKYNFRSHDHMRLLQDKNMNCYSSLHKILQDILFIEKKGKTHFQAIWF